MPDLIQELGLNAITAAAASFAGAYGAWAISRRAERIDSLDREIVATNGAIGICSTVANTMIAVKRQRILPLHLAYVAAETKFAAVQPGVAQTVIDADLQSFYVPFFPIADLRASVATVKRSTRAPIVMASLQLALENFSVATSNREMAIGMMQGTKDEAERVALYFGTPGSFKADTRYRDSVRALRLYCDDVIYFSLLLAHVLQRHGESLVRQRGPAAPRVSSLNADDPLIPPGSDYPAFERQFRLPAVAERRAGLQKLGYAARSAWASFMTAWGA